VSSVTLLRGHRRITGAVIHFSGAVSDGSAGNTANYSVQLLKPGRRTRHGVRTLVAGKAVGITTASYDPNGHLVIVDFAATIAAHQALQLRISGGQGGISDPSGNPLNSPAQGVAGSDYVITLNSGGS
jgi:hypothetical protein